MGRKRWSHIDGRFEVLGTILNAVSVQRLRDDLFLGEEILTIPKYLSFPHEIEPSTDPNVDKFWLRPGSEDEGNDPEPWVTSEADTQIITRKIWEKCRGGNDVGPTNLFKYPDVFEEPKFYLSFIQYGIIAVWHPATPFSTEGIIN